MSMIFVNNFVEDENNVLKFISKAEGNEQQGIIFRVYVKNGRAMYDYRAVECINGILESNTPKEKMVAIKLFANVPIKLLELCVRFDSRFERWLTGQVDSRCFFIDDVQSKITAFDPETIDDTTTA